MRLLENISKAFKNHIEKPDNSNNPIEFAPVAQSKDL